jgi:myo-inositol 2-dehydrogenase/D-chiro-inositol 1-dehydrogenase
VTHCRIGFVGAGGVATRHATMLTGFADAELVAVADCDPARASAFADRFGGRAVPDVPALAGAGIDAAYVCIPPGAHGPAEVTLAAAGIPMFVEKPIALDAGTAERVAMALDQAGVRASVGHHWRYSAPVRQAREALADRPVRLAVGAWLDRVPPVPWWVHRDQSGGQVVEQAIHVLDLARLLVGEVTEVHAVADGEPPGAPGADVDGATVATLRFAGGAVGALAATCLLGWRHRAGLEVFADGLALSVGEEALEIRDGSAAPRVREADPDIAKRAADRDFVDAVLGRSAGVRTPYTDALRTHRLAHAIAESATRGATVRLGETANGR